VRVLPPVLEWSSSAPCCAGAIAEEVDEVGGLLKIRKIEQSPQ
jgi:hypothetical protein